MKRIFTDVLRARRISSSATRSSGVCRGCTVASAACAGLRPPTGRLIGERLRRRGNHELVDLTELEGALHRVDADRRQPAAAIGSDQLVDTLAIGRCVRHAQRRERRREHLVRRRPDFETLGLNHTIRDLLRHVLARLRPASALVVLGLGVLDPLSALDGVGGEHEDARRAERR